MAEQQQLNVLILEDHADDADLMVYELRRSGYAVRAERVETRQAYQSALANHYDQFDIVLADYRLPQYNALEALDYMHQHGYSLPFIVVTGAVSEEDAVACIKAGASDYLLKDRLARLGNAVRQALQEKKLVQEKQQADYEIQRRTNQLAALAQMGQAIASTLDLEAVLDQLTAAVPLLVNADGVGVLLRQGQDRLYFAAATGKGAKGLKGMYMPVTQGVAGAVVQNKRSYLVAEQAKEDDVEIYRKPEQVSGYHTRSLVAVPLMHGGEVMGVLEAVDEKPDAFSAEDLRVLETAAIWAANAIVNARQHAQIQRQLKETQVLSEISQALSAAPALDEILQLIADASIRIVNQAERAVIHLYNPVKDILVPAAVAGMTRGKFSRVPMRPGAGIAGQVMETGTPLNVKDTETDERFLSTNPGKTNLRSLFVAPVQSGVQRLGTISISSSLPNAFAREDEQLIVLLGVQAALAIDRARLFEEIRQRARRLELLNEITRIALQSQSLDAFLPFMANRFCSLLAVDDCYIALWDESLQIARPTAASRRVHDLYRQFTPVPGEPSITNRVLSAAKPQVVHKTDVGKLISKRAFDLFPFAALLSVPMIVGGSKLGAVQFAFETDHEFTLDEIANAENVVGQMALVISNTRFLETSREALHKEQVTRSQLVQSEKLAAMGRLVASVAHELNNPLQSITNALYLLKMDEELSEQASQDLDVMLTEIERMSGLINRLRQAYRPVTSEAFEYTDFNLLVDEVTRLIAAHLRQNNVVFSVTPDPTLPMAAMIADQIKQVILNLALNGVQAMPEGGTLTGRTGIAKERISGGEPVAGIWFEISDTGVGIPQDQIKNIFDPFYTTKPGGTGLGLWISYDIVQRHKGKMEVSSHAHQGTTFRVWIPQHHFDE